MRRPLVITALLLVAAEVTVRALAPALPPAPTWPDNEMATKAKRVGELSRHHHGTDLVLLGSSTMDVAADASVLSGELPLPRGAYNAAFASASLPMIERWATRLVTPRLRPTIVVIGVSARELNANAHDQRQDLRNFLQAPEFRHLWKRRTPLERLTHGVEQRSAIVRYRAILRKPLRIFDPVVEEDADQRVDGAGMLHVPLYDRPYGSPPPPTKATKLPSEPPPPPPLPFVLSRTRVTELRRLVASLRARGVKVLAVNMPVTDDYVTYFGQAGYERAKEAIRQVAETTGSAYLDGGIWPHSLFGNPAHVNPRGAQQFTTMLVDALRPLTSRP